MGHIDILVVVVRRLRWKVKTLLAGPSPTSPMKAEITISPISNIIWLHAVVSTHAPNKFKQNKRDF